VICAQFGKDLFNISKVIGHKKVAQFFWLTVYYNPVGWGYLWAHKPSQKGPYLYTWDQGTCGTANCSAN